jgi:Ca2+-binding RTX toxin-like protein
MATTTKITLDGADLVGADPLKPLHISKPLAYYSTFDTTVLGAIAAFEGEHLTAAVPAVPKTADTAAEPAKAAIPGSWLPKVSGLDAFDSNVTTLQTVNLYTNAGSSLIIKTQNTDAANNSNSYDFTSSDGAIHVLTNSTISNAAPVVVVNPKAKPVKVNPNIKLSYDDRSNSVIYTNTGATGIKDDIKASLTQISHAISTVKNEVFSAKITYKEAFSYLKGEEYQVDISSAKTVLSDSPAISFSSTKNNFVITRYDFLLKEGFSISLKGTISGSWGTDGNTEIMNLKNVAIETKNFSLKTAATTYTQTYTNEDYFTKSGLTNLDTYNLTPIDNMQSDIETRVFSKILAGDNLINLKPNAVAAIDAGAGNDIVTGSAKTDTLIGGAGSDKLTGGKGSDTFSFKAADFLTENSIGDMVFNKSVDTITDFNAKDGDTLSFDEQSLNFPHDLPEAKTAKMPLFYLKGSVYFDVNPSEEIYTPTIIIKLTGNPKVNADFSGWDVPVLAA